MGEPSVVLNTLLWSARLGGGNLILLDGPSIFWTYRCARVLLLAGIHRAALPQRRQRQKATRELSRVAFGTNCRSAPVPFTS
jgi:hypothetical protein